jgi:lysophospholipid acyltransferase (LPLAT)-like uncharacterized protein
MKLRHPALIRAASWAGSWALRAWVGTLRFRYVPLGANLDPRQKGFRGRYIYAFWHENMLLPAYHYGRADIQVLISTHADGQLIAEVCRRLGFGLVRGSTTRGGADALRQMLRASESSHIAITPDGPRGPRRRVQPGMTYLAARTGLPIVPMGIGYDRPWRLRSWDRFALPRPGSRAVLVTGAPIPVPADADRGTLDHYRALVEVALLDATAAAERWAAEGVPLDLPRSHSEAV